MGVLEFVAQIIGALAWPTFALVIILVVRKPLVAMLKDVALRRLKVGPFEAEWERVTADVKDQIGAQPPVGEDAPHALEIELSSEVAVAPAVAVLEAFSLIEREIRDILTAAGITDVRGGAVVLAREALRRELISRESVSSVKGLSVLRNLVAHGSAREVSSAQAAEYVALADAVLFALRGESGRAAQ
ncbi:hypothetical protein [Actinokineospora globicatena]|uniref:DUF4145 domain-containing protein n=1 Tax=Actinokineospora globicatena TaxID=103729 RepID=A0A9W6QNM4_9PSEU|nr:hypothetical protein [Actinokineospora globicatena]GLW92877.1 hypothetical protein Aglo03_36930 [Actinokineospora globicatena]